MFKVKKITISRPTGYTEYIKKFPVEFTSFKEVEKFFNNNIKFLPLGGYEKHDIVVEWEDGSTYSYRGDLSHPKGNCYCSLEYNPGKRIKSACFYQIREFEKGEKWIHEDEYNRYKEYIANCDLSDLSEDALNKIAEKDSETCKINEKNQKEEQYREEFISLKKSLAKAPDIKIDKNEKKIDVGNKFFEAYYSKNNYIRWFGAVKMFNPGTHLEEVVVIMGGYKLGDKAKAEYGNYNSSWGMISSITDKNIIIKKEEGDCFYSGAKSKRVDHRWFFLQHNQTDRQIESIEHKEAYRRAYSD